MKSEQMPERAPKKVAIIQSNYIPWKGYFDLINSVDEFMLYDDAQYTKRDWRNRNQLKSMTGLLWLSVPVEVKGKFFQPIKETRIAEAKWGRKHWSTLQACYGKAEFFKTYKDLFEPLFVNNDSVLLSEVNRGLTEAICAALGIRTKITASMDYKLEGDDPSERLAMLCEQANATEYLSGPSAKDYMKSDCFDRRQISIRYFDYSGYPEYRQMYPPFEHAVTILDLLFNEGPAAPKFMKSFGEEKTNDQRVVP